MEAGSGRRRRASGAVAPAKGHQGESIEVTFEETIQLPPGTYIVQVRLNEFESRDQVEDLGGEVLPRIQANLIHHEEIVIE
jgi:hypothetical protein